MGRGQSLAETEAFLYRVIAGYSTFGFGLHAAIEKRSGQLTGWVGLSVPNFLPEILPAVEVGWRLGSAWRGRGYATEAGAAWVQWGFESFDLARIVSIYEPANTPSGRVMAKLGFELDRVSVHPVLGIDLHVTALARNRWQQLLAAQTWPAEGIGRV